MNEPTKLMVVSMSDGSEWEIPVEVIARHRAMYYTKRDCERNPKLDGKLRFQEEMEHALNDHFELIDWASNNMDWKDVAGFATRRPVEPAKEPNREEMWVNGKKRIVPAPESNEDAYALARKEKKS